MITSKEGGEDAAWANRAGRRAQRMQKRALTCRQRFKKPIDLEKKDEKVSQNVERGQGSRKPGREEDWRDSLAEQ